MGGLIRLPDWQPRLGDWLRAAREMPFQPGRHDCCLFGAGAVEAQTGVDLAAGWRGRYRTLRGGLRILRQAGHADHVALLAALLPAIPAALAREGDLALVDTAEGPAVGVNQGGAIYVLRPGGGLGLVPRQPGLRMFRVG